MRTVLHLTVHGTSPAVDWYVPTDNIAQIIDASPVVIIPLQFPANLPSTGGAASGIAVNETFANIMAAIGSSSIQQMVTLTAYNVSPVQYYYVPSASITSINPSTSLGTIVNTDPTFASGSWSSGQFQVNETPAAIAAEIGTVATP